MHVWKFSEKRYQLHDIRPFVRLSLRMEQVGSHWKDFHEIWYLSIFRKFVKKIHISLKSDKNNGSFKRRSMLACDIISINFSQNENYFRQICI